MNESAPYSKPSEAWERRIRGAIVLNNPDLLVINKVDLAPLEGADLTVMDADSKRMRDTRPFIFSNLKQGDGVDQIVAFIEQAGGLSPVRH